MRKQEPVFTPYPEMQEPERESDDKDLQGIRCADGVYRVIGTPEMEQYLGEARE